MYYCPYVGMATQRLLEQEAEERRKMEEFEAKMSKKKRKKGKKKKGKSGKKKGKKSATKFESGWFYFVKNCLFRDSVNYSGNYVGTFILAVALSFHSITCELMNKFWSVPVGIWPLLRPGCPYTVKSLI